jgi:GLPGLI family protein
VKFYSENQKLFDSIMKKQMPIFETTRKIVMPTSLPMAKVQTIIYFNYPKEKITVRDKIVIHNYEYTENIENIKWQFYPDETKELLGYNCKKAMCTFRGRDYEVWYAPDIPVNAGVWKFSGLPGLILHITDTKKQVQFACEFVEKISVPIIKDEVESNIQKISREKYMELERKYHKDPMSVMGEFSRGTGTDANGNPLPPPKNIPYNPIELE